MLAGFLKARVAPEKHWPFFRSGKAFGVAILFLAGHFFSWLWILSWAENSVVVPVTASAYLFSALLAQTFFRERIGPRQWLGITLIVIGILVVAHTGGEL